MAHIRFPGSANWMHIIFGVAPIVNASVNVGDITTSITPPTSGTLTIDQLEYSLTNETITAGKAKVIITNLGGTITGGSFVDITVNGNTLKPDSIPYVIEKHLDRVNEVEELLPQIDIVNASGAMVRIEVFS
jgi:hypothetical protein